MPRYRSTGILFGHRVEIGKHLRGDLQRRCLEILAKMGERRCSGNHQDVWRTVEQPGKRNLHRRGMEARCRIRQSIRLQWSEPAERKEWNVSNPFACKVSDECIVFAMRQVVMVLDADDGDDAPRFRDLCWRHVA